MKKLFLPTVAFFFISTFISCKSEITVKCFLVKENKFIEFKNPYRPLKSKDIIFLENLGIGSFFLRKDSFGIQAIVDTVYEKSKLF